MMPINLTHDENVDGSINVLFEGGTGVYKLSHFIKKHRKSENEKLTADALSMYRGGDFTPENEEALKDLLQSLRSSDAEIPLFEFHGNKGELSYFWKQQGGKNVSLSLDTIESIGDAELKAEVKKVFAQSYIDGFAEYNRKTNALDLTDKGRAYIYKTDFIERRLNAELARSQGITEEALMKASERMTSRGLVGYDFVTVNKRTLVVSENGKELFCRVPKTNARDYIKLPANEYYSLDEKTFELYISQSKSYTVYDVNGVEKGTVYGNDLVSHYEIKTAQEAKAFATELQPEANKVVAAFWEKPGYKEVDGATFKRGDFVFSADDSFSVHQYRIAYGFENTENGEVLYHLKPCEDGLPELIQNESNLGKNLFKGRTEAEKALSTDAGKKAALEASESIAKELHTIKLASDVATTITNPTAGVVKDAAKVIK